jgi:hypothetical protein
VQASRCASVPLPKATTLEPAINATAVVMLVRVFAIGPVLMKL